MRDVAASVQAVTIATQQATEAMQDVCGVSQTAGEASQRVLGVADELGRTANALGKEIKQFLEAMTHSDEETRRRYERLAGRGAIAVLQAPGEKPQQVVIHDLSRGGVGLRCDWSAPAGLGVMVGLPGADAPVPARVVRWEGGVLGLSFQQKEEMLQQVDHVIADIEAMELGEAA
jgi:hypothetical protein